MFKRLVAAVAALGLAGAFALPALAHHSHAMFDHSQEVTINGVVTAYSFANPHVYLFLNVTNADGTTTKWGVEMSHVANMMGRGINRGTFKEGDTVEITMNPLHGGQPGGNYTAVVSINGTAFAAP